MKRLSSPSHSFLAAANTTESSAVMSSRRPAGRRGTQYQVHRGVSHQSYSSSRAHFITGDSHFQSVSDANRGFRPVGEAPNFPNQYRPSSVHSSPYSNPHPPQFNRGFRPPQQFRPRPPKPLDHRNWEYPKLRPPPHCERFRVLSYNILADYLANNHRSKLYFHIPPKMLQWEWRKKNIIFELGLWSADILCFQEVDKFQDLEEELKLRGYSGIWKMRTGDPVDGCAIFWHVSKFKLLHEECIEFNKLGLRDNVAQICVLESLNQNDTKDVPDFPSSLAGSNKVVICNIHVLYNPKRGEIKLGQIRVLLDRAHAVSKLWDDAPLVLCGDFNCTPKSPLYNYIAEQKLKLSDLPRDKISGQASAEIHRPMQFGHGIRAQHAYSRGGASSVVDPGELNQSGSPLVVQQQSHPESSVKLQSVNSSSQPQCVRSWSNLYPSNPYIGRCAHEDVENCKDETPCGGLRESLCSSHNNVGVFVEQMKKTNSDNNLFSSLVSISGLQDNHISPWNEGKVSGAQRRDGYEFTSVDSRQEDLRETPHEKEMQASIDAQFDSITEQSEPNLQTENIISSGKRSKLSFLSTNDNTDAITDPRPSDDMIGGKMENLPLDELPEIDDGDQVFDENSTNFLSELHEFSSSNLSHAEKSDSVKSDESFKKNEPHHAFNIRYDPSAWTPMEIEAATGNADCTLVEHPLKLRSTYSEVEDCSGTRDSNGEPLVTSYNRCFLGTVDYIWRSEGLKTVGVLAPIPKHAMLWTPGFPTKKWGSDHIALVSELAFAKDSNIQSS